jgi:hypothetical protein
MRPHLLDMHPTLAFDEWTASVGLTEQAGSQT